MTDPKKASTMRRLITDSITGRDNATFDLVRLSGALLVPFTMAMTVYSVAWQGKPWDVQSFGIGVGSVLVAVGAALNLKEKSE